MPEVSESKTMSSSSLFDGWITALFSFNDLPCRYEPVWMKKKRRNIGIKEIWWKYVYLETKDKINMDSEENNSKSIRHRKSPS